MKNNNKIEILKLTKNFIGSELKTHKGSILIISGIHHITKNKEKVFTVHCSKCSQDLELHPEGSIKTYKSSLLSGSIPCGCSDAARYTQKQYKIIVERWCDDHNMHLIGYGDKKLIGKTKVIRKCNICGEITKNTSINRLEEISTCKGCIKISRKERKDYINKFLKTGSYGEDCTFNPIKYLEKSKTWLWEYSCPKCSSDEYVQAGVCDGIFQVHESTLLSGGYPCRCGTNHQRTREQLEFKIKKTLKEECCTIVSFLWDDNEKNSTNRFMYKCENGHVVSPKITEYLNDNQRCPTCRSSGFKEYIPAYLYITHWFDTDKNINYIKFGITNNEVSEREKTQARHSKLKPKLLKTFHFNLGKEAKELESAIMEKFKDFPLCPKDLLPDGYTETIPYTELDNLCSFVQEYLNK